eukprot:UN09579
MYNNITLWKQDEIHYTWFNIWHSQFNNTNTTTMLNLLLQQEQEEINSGININNIDINDDKQDK